MEPGQENTKVSSPVCSSLDISLESEQKGKHTAGIRPRKDHEQKGPFPTQERITSYRTIVTLASLRDAEGLASLLENNGHTCAVAMSQSLRVVLSRSQRNAT